MEQEAAGLYTNRVTRRSVAVYYNQTIADDSRLLGDIGFARFKPNARVEFHGCKTATDIPLFDNFAKQFSDELASAGKMDATVTAHTDYSTPQFDLHDYRHGPRRVYKGGELCEEIK